MTSAAQQWTVTKTPLQRQIDLLVRVIILIVGLMSMAILGQAVLENLPLVRLVQISAVLSGLVPYGLFFLIAVAYAVGAADIYRRGALSWTRNVGPAARTARRGAWLEESLHDSTQICRRRAPPFPP